jgi:hypothetical protein
METNRASNDLGTLDNRWFKPWTLMIDTEILARRVRDLMVKFPRHRYRTCAEWSRKFDDGRCPG